MEKFRLIHNQLSRCSTARGSSSRLSLGDPTKVKAVKSFIFPEGSPKNNVNKPCLLYNELVK